MRAVLVKLISLLLGGTGLQPSLLLWLAGLMVAIQRLLPQQYREALQLMMGRSSAHYRLYGRVHRWCLLTWSQLFALGFMLSAIAWFVFRLSTTDMAFVWSTTLDIEPQTMAITNSLALPWASGTPSDDRSRHHQENAIFPCASQRVAARRTCRGTRALVAVCARRHDHVRPGATSARADDVPVAAAWPCAGLCCTRLGLPRCLIA